MGKLRLRDIKGMADNGISVDLRSANTPAAISIMSGSFHLLLTNAMFLEKNTVDVC